MYEIYEKIEMIKRTAVVLALVGGAAAFSHWEQVLFIVFITLLLYQTNPEMIRCNQQAQK